MTRPIIRLRPLSYVHSLGSRPLGRIDLVVVHCTELPDLAEARAYGERVVYSDSGTGNSGHYYVDRDGGIEQWVPSDRVAHHTRGFNERSIGIELVNRGRYPDWYDSRRQTMTEPYRREQVQSLVALLHSLQRDLPALRWIAGHEALDTEKIPACDAPEILIYRKRDPGPLFPWDSVLGAVSLSLLETVAPSK